MANQVMLIYGKSDDANITELWIFFIWFMYMLNLFIIQYFWMGNVRDQSLNLFEGIIQVYKLLITYLGPKLAKTL